MPGKREFSLVAASIVFAGLVIEAGLRIADVSYPVFHRLETLRGWSPIPGISGKWMTEGEAIIENNEEGFRDKNHALKKPNGTIRLAVIGDSMSEALAVPLANTYPALLERNLVACLDRQVEVLNFSVSGYGTAQQRLTLQHNVLKYQPDIVLLAFFTGNDVWNNEPALDGHEDRIYYVLEDGALTLDDSNTQTSRFKLKMLWRGTINTAINASRLFQLIREFSTRAKAIFRRKKPSDGILFNPKSADYQIFKPPSTAPWTRAWAATEALITAMRDDVKAAGGTFWLGNLVAPVQVYPDTTVRQEFAQALGVENLDYPDQRLAAFAQRQGIPAVTLLAPLRHYADTHKAYLHGFKNTRLGTGHWNETGHQVAAMYLGKELCRSLQQKNE